MAIFVAIVIVIALAFAAWLVNVARKETRMVERPHEGRPRRRRSRLMATGETCVCGGLLGPSGQESAKYGQLLGCTGCTRSWTMSGQRIRRRTVPVQAPAAAPPS